MELSGQMETKNPYVSLTTEELLFSVKCLSEAGKMILDAIRQAQQMYRKVLEETYDGLYWIYEYQKGWDEKTKLTKSGEALVKEKIPCHLLYSSIPTAV